MKKPDLKTARRQFKHLLLTNPNYFGQLSEMEINTDYPLVEKIVFNTAYEAIKCVSYHPQSEELRATILLKQDSGYGGDLCTGGSLEFVRFYIDYQNDGNWTDLGSVNFTASNLDFGNGGVCYGVALKIDPAFQKCCDKTPVLPKVRAILSWNTEPPADQPNHVPVWGDRKEAYIQLKPSSSLFCYLDHLDLSPKVDINHLLGEINTQPKPIANALNSILFNTNSLPKLEKPFVYPDFDKVPLGRSGLQSIQKVLTLNTYDAFDAIQSNFFNLAADQISDAIKFITQPQFNTTYEEVECVALDRNTSILHADIRIKKSSGYSGDLCHSGSREFIAFYLDSGAGWQYMGTTSVVVHDIESIPADGLMYHAYLPTSLSEHQKEWCESGKARVRAILSWNVRPARNNPDYVAVWGDREDCTVEIRPFPKSVIPGDIFPIVDAVGNIDPDHITDGFATGPGLVSGLEGDESPFDGRIEVKGRMGNAPSYLSGGVQLKYRLMKKGPLDTDFQPIFRRFKIQVEHWVGGVPNSKNYITQTPDPAEGWMPYYPDHINNIFVSNNLLGVFVPPEEGLHQLRVDIQQGSSFVSSEVFSVMVDKDAPVVELEITSGTGDCGEFQKGDIIKGTFSASDAHPSGISFAVTPSNKANGANAEFLDADGASITKSSIRYGDPLLGTYMTGEWQLDTSDMDSCGYNIRLHMGDRTIMNSVIRNRQGSALVGFCLAGADDSDNP